MKMWLFKKIHKYNAKKFTSQTNTFILIHTGLIFHASQETDQKTVLKLKNLKKNDNGRGKVCVCVRDWAGGGGGGGGGVDDGERKKKWNWNSSNLTNILIKKEHSQSAFFKDCFFLEGLEMTLMRLLWKTPMSCPPP